MGALVSLVFILISTLFLWSKIMVLVNDDAVSVTDNYIEGAIDPTQKFGHETGLFIAAALTEFSHSAESIEDPRYGELVFEKRGWGEFGDEFNIYQRPIQSHQCSDKELGLVKGDDSSVIYPINEESR